MVVLLILGFVLCRVSAGVWLNLVYLLFGCVAAMCC